MNLHTPDFACRLSGPNNIEYSIKADKHSILQINNLKESEWEGFIERHMQVKHTDIYHNMECRSTNSPR